MTMAHMHEESTESAVTPREIRARTWTYFAELGLWGVLPQLSASRAEVFD